MYIQKLAQEIREQMLFSNKRNKLLSLEEILEVEKNFYQAINSLSLYGMTSKEFYNKGIRILGRTSIECTIDHQAKQIAYYATKIKDDFFPNKKPLLIDLFMGSGNLLYHISHALESNLTIGLEKEEQLYELTKRNLEILSFNCLLYCENSLENISNISYPQDVPIAIIVDPPWGDKFNLEKGLDLLETNPPLDQIIYILKRVFKGNSLYLFIKTYEKMVESSLNYIRSLFPYSTYYCTESLSIKTGILIGKASSY